MLCMRQTSLAAPTPGRTAAGGTHHSCVEARERLGVSWIADSGLLISRVVPLRVRVVAPLSISSESILCPFCAAARGQPAVGFPGLVTGLCSVLELCRQAGAFRGL